MKKLILLVVIFQTSGLLLGMDPGNKELEEIFSRPTPSQAEYQAMGRLTGSSIPFYSCSSDDGKRLLNIALEKEFGSPKGLSRYSPAVQKEVKADVNVVVSFLDTVKKFENRKK